MPIAFVDTSTCPTHNRAATRRQPNIESGNVHMTGRSPSQARAPETLHIRHAEPCRDHWSDVRVVEACGPIGHYAGRLLADLGADVIKVEPPTGDPARQYAPYLPGVDAPENGLQFLLLNANKRGVSLDLTGERGRALFLRLVASADVLLDSWQPRESAALGLAEADLLAAKPDLIRASVTGWGLTGPYADWAYADIVAQAMSGVMTLAGFPDGPPEQIADHQGYQRHRSTPPRARSRRCSTMTPPVRASGWRFRRRKRCRWRRRPR